MTPRLLSLLAPLGLLHCGPAPASCPDGGTGLTYDNFGRTFMTAYCIACHAGARVEKGVLLNSASSVRTFASQSNAQAGVGASMPPPGVPAPTATERQQLSQWIGCGAP